MIINDPLPVLPGNEQDLCHENIDLVNTYLFYQVCKVHVSDTSLPMHRRPDTLASDISANTILAHVGRMIYFRENSNI